MPTLLAQPSPLSNHSFIMVHKREMIPFRYMLYKVCVCPLHYEDGELEKTFMGITNNLSMKLQCILPAPWDETCLKQS